MVCNIANLNSMKISACFRRSAFYLCSFVLLPVGFLAAQDPDKVADEPAAKPPMKPAPAKPATPTFDELRQKIVVDKKPLATLKGVVLSYADSLEEVMPAVVTIYSTKEVASPSRSSMFDDPLFRRFFGTPNEEDELELPPRTQQGLGSGVIISSDGYILTNNHVVDDADSVMVSLPTDRRDYEATVVGADPQTDVALIKIDATGLKSVTIGDSSKLRVGDVTLAIGNPFGLEQTVTSGIVSGLARNSLNITGGGYENFIQTDASINQGNSGGALVDASGRLVGINTAIQSDMAGGNIGIGFAIPANMALDIVQRLLDGGGNVRRGFLGVYLNELDSEMAETLGRDDKSGVMIVEVGPDTPAAVAGLKAGDLIVGFNGKPVDSMPRLRLDISNTPPGKAVRFDLIRKGEEMRIDVTLGDLEERSVAFAEPAPEPGPDPDAEAKEEFIPGVVVVELDEAARAALGVDEATKGVVVESVKADSAASEAGLKVGQIITEVDQEKVASVDEVFAQIKGFDGELLYLQVYGDGRKGIVVVKMKE
jgi:serine protease Do